MGAHIEVLQTELDYGIFELVLESPVLEIIKLFRIYGFDPEKGYGNPPRIPLQAAVIGRYQNAVGVAVCLLDSGWLLKGAQSRSAGHPFKSQPTTVTVKWSNFSLNSEQISVGAMPTVHILQSERSSSTGIWFC